MPKTEVVYYADEHGDSPLLRRFNSWPTKVLDKCHVRIERLQEMGYELRRPEAEFLRDGIYELRLKHVKVNYRILYFFHNETAILFDGLTKDDVVPAKQIDKAIAAKRLFTGDPTRHTYEA